MSPTRRISAGSRCRRRARKRRSRSFLRARDTRIEGIDTSVGFGTDDVAATHADLREKGVNTDDIISPGDPVPSMFFFRDQDGNKFVIAEEATESRDPCLGAAPPRAGGSDHVLVVAH